MSGGTGNQFLEGNGVRVTLNKQSLGLEKSNEELFLGDSLFVPNYISKNEEIKVNYEDLLDLLINEDSVNEIINSTNFKNFLKNHFDYLYNFLFEGIYNIEIVIKSKFIKDAISIIKANNSMDMNPTTKLLLESKLYEFYDDVIIKLNKKKDQDFELTKVEETIENYKIEAKSITEEIVEKDELEGKLELEIEKTAEEQIKKPILEELEQEQTQEPTIQELNEVLRVVSLEKEPQIELLEEMEKEEQEPTIQELNEVLRVVSLEKEPQIELLEEMEKEEQEPTIQELNEVLRVVSLEKEPQIELLEEMEKEEQEPTIQELNEALRVVSLEKEPQIELLEELEQEQTPEPTIQELNEAITIDFEAAEPTLELIAEQFQEPTMHELNETLTIVFEAAEPLPYEDFEKHTEESVDQEPPLPQDLNQVYQQEVFTKKLISEVNKKHNSKWNKLLRSFSIRTNSILLCSNKIVPSDTEVIISDREKERLKKIEIKSKDLLFDFKKGDLKELLYVVDLALNGKSKKQKLEIFTSFVERLKKQKKKTKIEIYNIANINIKAMIVVAYEYLINKHHSIEKKAEFINGYIRKADNGELLEIL